MAGSASSNLTYPSLSADQQKLLLAALTSNKRHRQLDMDQFHNSALENEQNLANGSSVKSPSEGVDPSMLDSASQRQGIISPMSAPTFGGGLLPEIVNDNNEFDVDIDLPSTDFDDSFAFDSTLDGDSGEKRKSPEDDDDEDEDGSPKRRESEDKGPKKPGRKPLTSEPTTKRKAQNRAAQRAFRERKEKHLKDLELKVADLEKASESADHEKSLLKAQITRLQAEVQDYRKRLSVVGNALNSSPSTDTSPYRTSSTGSSTGFDFPFDFPIFGGLSNSETSPNETTELFSSNSLKRESFSRANSDATSPQNPSLFFSNSASPSNLADNSSPQAYNSNVITNGDAMTSGFVNFNDSSLGFSSLVSSPPALTNGSTSPAQSGTNPFKFNSTSESSPSNAASPSNSSISHHGPGSSVATSPEPANHANGDGSSMHNQKLGTNGNFSSFASYQNSAAQDFNLDLSTFQFDPSLFGTYRDTQQAILGDGEFSGGLYDDYIDFGLDSYPLTNGNAPKKNTPAPLQSPQEKDEDLFISTEEKVSKNPKKLEEQNMMTCNRMWEELYNCPKFNKGELDVDSLCSELSKKATCTERGAAIPKAEWEAALWRLVGQEEKSPGESTSDALARAKKGTT